jgi:flagellar biosynthesis protein FlhF
MPLFKEQARTYNKCIEQIRIKYGDSFTLHDQKTVWKEGLFGRHREIEISGSYGLAAPIKTERPSIPTDLETAKRQVLNAAGKAATAYSAEARQIRSPASDLSIQALAQEIAALRGEIRSLSEKAGEPALSSSSKTLAGNETIHHPSIQKLEADLLLNEFTPSFTAKILDRARKEFHLDELDDYDEVQKRIVLWIGEKISVYQENEQPVLGKKKARVIVLVGPSGTGKTTTLLKLAALFGEFLKEQEGKFYWRKQVRLVTMDRRIGAEHQLEKHGEIMDIPVSVADSHDSLKKVLSLYRQGTDYILVDTIGRSPKDYVELGKLKAVLDACPAKTEFLLCIQASTKAGDLRNILKQYEPFKYKSVIITKLDETDRAGNLISVLSEENKSISFITTGQALSKDDIEQATIIRLLINLEGFAVDRHALVDHFRGV